MTSDATKLLPRTVADVRRLSFKDFRRFMTVAAVSGQPIGRRCSWWPTGAAPASLIPVDAVVFICGLSDVLINEYLLYLLLLLLAAILFFRIDFVD